MYKPSLHEELVKKQTRRPQRSWKVHRKTKYHRLAGLTAKQAKILVGI